MTDQPYTWDSLDELAAWALNPVTKGPVALQGEGRAGFIRVQQNVERVNVVLRSPDFTPPVTALRGVRFRYRWIVDRPAGIPEGGDHLGGGASGHLGKVQPVAPAWPRGLLVGSLNGTPTAQDWRDANFAVEPRGSGSDCPGTCPGAGGTIDARYVYFEFFSLQPGRLDIDSITLLR